ncbi:MAG: hypothetical protein AAGD01_11085 [Acidobacteriota bacterium]
MEVMFESSKKSEPFGAHLATKLEDSNHKLVCALSSRTTCTDDLPPTDTPDHDDLVFF